MRLEVFRRPTSLLGRRAVGLRDRSATNDRRHHACPIFETIRIARALAHLRHAAVHSGFYGFTNRLTGRSFLLPWRSSFTALASLEIRIGHLVLLISRFGGSIGRSLAHLDGLGLTVKAGAAVRCSLTGSQPLGTTATLHLRLTGFGSGGWIAFLTGTARD